MAATDGDSQEVVDSGNAIPNLGEVRVEVHAVDISVSSNSGSTSLDWDEDFGGGEVYVQVSGDEAGDFFASSAGSSQATVEAASTATADGTVTAFVLAVGPE